MWTASEAAAGFGDFQLMSSGDQRRLGVRARLQRGVGEAAALYPVYQVIEELQRNYLCRRMNSYT